MSHKADKQNICKFCGNERPLVDAHIIPRAFFEYIKFDNGKETRGVKLKGLTNSKDIFPYTSTTKGIYDSNLVCAACEKLFGTPDQYAIELLLKNDDHIPHYLNGDLIAWKIESYDYVKLMLFFISLLWRAGASNLLQFQYINLGPFQDIAKTAIETKDIKDIQLFSVFLSRFEKGIGRHLILDPHPEVKKGIFTNINVYRFYLGAGYSAYIKVDSRSFSADFNGIQLSKGNILYIVSRGKFEESGELTLVKNIYTQAEKLSIDWKNKKRHT